MFSHVDVFALVWRVPLNAAAVNRGIRLNTSLTKGVIPRYSSLVWFAILLVKPLRKLNRYVP